MKFFSSKRGLSRLVNLLNSDLPRFRSELAALVRDHLNGQWKRATSQDLLIVKLRGGLSNTVLRVTLSGNDPNELKNEDKTVILRFHQEGNNSSLDLESESQTFKHLSERNIGPKLLATFPGGRIEEFIDGRPLKTDELGDMKFSLAIAEKMALFHSANLPLSKKEGLLFNIMEKWLYELKESNSWKSENFETQKCIDFFRGFDLVSEIAWLKKYLGSIDSPTMLCHNDIQEGNILVHLESVHLTKPQLRFIDFEYCFYNYRGFDFANHFLEYTMNYEKENYPNFLIDEQKYPSQKHQLAFIRHYVNVIEQLNRTKGEKRGENSTAPTEFSGIISDTMPEISETSDVSDQEIKFLSEISNFRLASHLFWSIWAALRSNSKISFGYWEYCEARLKAYSKLKEEI